MNLSDRPVIQKTSQLFFNFHLRKLISQIIGVLKFNIDSYKEIQADPSIQAHLIIILIAIIYGSYSVFGAYVSDYQLKEILIQMNFEENSISDYIWTFILSFFGFLLISAIIWQGWSALTNKISKRLSEQIDESTPSEITRLLAFSLTPFIFTIFLNFTHDLVKFILLEYLIHFEFVQFIAFESPIYQIFNGIIAVLAFLTAIIYVLAIGITSTKLVFKLSSKTAFFASTLSYLIVWGCYTGILFLLRG